MRVSFLDHPLKHINECVALLINCCMPCVPQCRPQNSQQSEPPHPWNTLISHVLKLCHTECTWRHDTFQQLPAHDEECHIQLTHSSYPHSAWSNISTVTLSGSRERPMTGETGMSGRQWEREKGEMLKRQVRENREENSVGGGGLGWERENLSG